MTELIIQDGLHNLQGRQKLAAKVIPKASNLENYVVEILDDSGTVLHMSAFEYQRRMTIPPIEGGEEGKPFVELVEPEAVLVLPYVLGAVSVRIVKGGKSFPSKPLSEGTVKVGGKVSHMAPANEGKLYILIIGNAFDSDTTSFLSVAAEIVSQFESTYPFTKWSPNVVINSYNSTTDLGCSAGSGGIARLMSCNSTSVTSAAAASGYYYDEIIVLHNTSTYAGGGYLDYGAYETNSYSSYCMVYNGYYTAAMAVHEFGHSFGDLCDEYTYTNEGSTSSTCVNCKTSCSTWSSWTSSCQSGCSSLSGGYRADDSIMLSLSISSFNAPSINLSLMPRIEYFAGSAPPTISTLSELGLVILTLSLMGTALY